MLEHLPSVVGQALSGRRAGLDQIIFNQVSLRSGTASIVVSSSAFVDHAPIPQRYTSDGAGELPPLTWRGVPRGTASVALVVEDADSPTPSPVVQLIVVGLPHTDGGMDADGLAALYTETPAPDAQHGGFSAARAGLNSLLGQGWLPPDPPPGHGVHRYAFQVFALAADASLSQTPGREELSEAIRSHGLGSGLLIGTYDRDPHVRAPATDVEPAATGLQGLAT